MALLCVTVHLNLQPFGQHASQNENLEYIYPQTSICDYLFRLVPLNILILIATSTNSDMSAHLWGRESWPRGYKTLARNLSC